MAEDIKQKIQGEEAQLANDKAVLASEVVVSDLQIVTPAPATAPIADSALQSAVDTAHAASISAGLSNTPEGWIAASQASLAAAYALLDRGKQDEASAFILDAQKYKQTAKGIL